MQADETAHASSAAIRHDQTAVAAVCQRPALLTAANNSNQMPHAKHLATKQSRVGAVASLLTGTRTPHARLSTKLALIATICTISARCASKSVTANPLRVSPAKQKILLRRYEFQCFSTMAPRICTSLLWWTRGLQFQQSTTQRRKSLVHTCSVRLM